MLYGGVSLAVYINGVAQEFFRLVRATAPEWPLSADVEQQRAWFPQNAGGRGDVEPLQGSERVYRRLGQLLPGNDDVPADAPIRTRFVVDILSGTSAGGINGIFLAKALANQQSIEALRQLWVDEGDIGVLLNDKRSYEDLVEGLGPQRPPRSLLNGYRLYVRAFQALRGMAGTEQRFETTKSPSYAEQVDLAVTTTDLHGLRLPIKLYDGVVQEARHKHVFRFAYWTREATGAERNDFKVENDAILAFAARCTSSFPFAFEPMVLDDLGDVLPPSEFPREGEPWRKFFGDYVRQGEEYRKYAFADGGYLDNKPFSHATAQLARRRADVPIDRRLIYIEPDPAEAPANGDAGPVKPRPEVFENVAAAVTKLPRAETIREDIDAVTRQSRAIARIREVTTRVVDEVGTEAVAGAQASLPPPGWSYTELRRQIVLDELAEVVAGVADIPDDSDAQYALKLVAGAWASESDLQPDELFRDYDLGFRLRRLTFLQHRINDLLRGRGRAARIGERLDLRAMTPETASKLLKVKMALNEIFVELRWRGRGVKRPELTAAELQLPETRGDPATAEEDGERFQAVANTVEASGLTADRLVALVLDPANEQVSSEDVARTRARHLAEEKLDSLNDVAAALKEVFELPFRAAEAAARQVLGGELSSDADAEAEARRWLRREKPEPETPDAEVEQPVAAAEAGDEPEEETPELVSGLDEIPDDLRGLLRWYYDEFDQIDALLLPLTYPDLGEVNPVEIIRISPQDAKSLINETDKDEQRRKLAGTGVHHFGGFLDRNFRINDIFWGRLDAAERIIETTLLPDHAQKALLVEAAQLAIIHEDLLGPLREPWVKAALSDTGTAAAAPEASLADLQAVLGEDWDDDRLREARAIRRHLAKKYEVSRKPDRRSTLDVVGRATFITSEVVRAAAASVEGVRRPMFWIGRVGQLLTGLAALATAPRQGELPRIIFRNVAVIAFLLGLALIGLGILGLGGAQKSGWVLIAVTIVAQVAVWVATAWVGAPDRRPGRVWPWVWRWLVGAMVTVIVAVVVTATVVGFAEIVERISERF